MKKKPQTYLIYGFGKPIKLTGILETRFDGQAEIKDEQDELRFTSKLSLVAVFKEKSIEV